MLSRHVALGIENHSLMKNSKSAYGCENNGRKVTSVTRRCISRHAYKEFIKEPFDVWNFEYEGQHRLSKKEYLPQLSVETTRDKGPSHPQTKGLQRQMPKFHRSE